MNIGAVRTESPRTRNDERLMLMTKIAIIDQHDEHHQHEERRGTHGGARVSMPLALAMAGRIALAAFRGLLAGALL